MPATQIDIATRHAVMLERLKVAEARDFNALIVELNKQVSEVYTMLAGSKLSDMTRAQLNGLLGSLKRAQDSALAAKQAQLMTRLERISEYETHFEKSSLDQLSGGAVPVFPATPSVSWALANAVPLSATGDLLGPWVKDMTTDEVAQINKVILRGFSEGWTNDDLRGILSGTKGQKYTDGLLSKMAKHNATIVRTAIQHVAATAREATWNANADIISRYKWLSTLDSRTSQQCRSLDGQTFEIGKGPRPPIHPNCRSTTIPVFKGKLAVLHEGRTRASPDGPVDADLTYYDWLEQQPAAFQKDVLGPARFALYKQPGMTAEKFAKLQLGSAFQPLTLAEMKLAENVVVDPVLEAMRKQYGVSWDKFEKGTQDIILRQERERPALEAARLVAREAQRVKDAAAAAAKAAKEASAEATKAAVFADKRRTGLWDYKRAGIENMNAAALVQYVKDKIAERSAIDALLPSTSSVFGARNYIHAMAIVNERFDLPKLKFFGDRTLDTRNAWGPVGRANAAFGIKQDSMLVNGRSFDDAELRTQKLRGKRNYKIDDTKFKDKTLLARVKEQMAFRDWTVTENARGVAFHEMGHRLEGKIKGLTAIGTRALRSDFKYTVSEYAMTNSHEIVAESFALYMIEGSGQHWRIFPALLEAFKKIDRSLEPL